VGSSLKNGSKYHSSVIINLGCGTKTSSHCVNIDRSLYLRIKKSRIASLLALRVLKGQRLERFQALDDTIVVHDLRRAIPFDDVSVDAVYHSHLLEHIDRSMVPRLLAEIYRVLKPGGVHRIVVPDLEELCKRYLHNLAQCTEEGTGQDEHDGYIAEIIEQMVRRESFGKSRQAPLWRIIERIILGDARRRGETHQWMYDRVNLRYLLECTGFRDIRVVDYSTSAIHDWNLIGLDQNEHGTEYKPGSLYMEALR